MSRLVRAGSETATLNRLVQETIRADYQEPRVHFALVSSAVSGPMLRSEPYVGSRLAEQLDDQARQFVGTTELNRFDSGSGNLWLSPIFRWYQTDFIKASNSVVAYVKPLLPEASRAALEAASRIRIRYTEYDWQLNDRKR